MCITEIKLLLLFGDTDQNVPNRKKNTVKYLAKN